MSWRTLPRYFRQLAMGIQALALLCLITGAVVMIAAISINRYRRQHELAILKALGGNRRLLLFSLGTEFGLIGGFAGLVGLSLGCLLSWSILHFFFDLTWTINLTGLAHRTPHDHHTHPRHGSSGNIPSTGSSPTLSPSPRITPLLQSSPRNMGTISLEKPSRSFGSRTFPKKIQFVSI